MMVKDGIFDMLLPMVMSKFGWQCFGLIDHIRVHNGFLVLSDDGKPIFGWLMMAKQSES